MYKIGFLWQSLDVFRVLQNQILPRSTVTFKWKMRLRKKSVFVVVVVGLGGICSFSHEVYGCRLRVNNGLCCVSVNNGEFIYYFLREQTIQVIRIT